MVVIDDLHELNSPETLDQLTRLLTSLPAGVHAMLTTRRDLSLRLHQLRLAGELAEIRAADLRFTERETRELLAASGIKLSEGGAALLHRRTEGWAAGLRLAALSLAGHPDPERFVADFSGTNRAVARRDLQDTQPGRYLAEGHHDQHCGAQVGEPMRKSHGHDYSSVSYRNHRHQHVPARADWHVTGRYTLAGCAPVYRS